MMETIRVPTVRLALVVILLVQPPLPATAFLIPPQNNNNNNNGQESTLSLSSSNPNIADIANSFLERVDTLIDQDLSTKRTPPSFSPPPNPRGSQQQLSPTPVVFEHDLARRTPYNYEQAIRNYGKRPRRAPAPAPQRANPEGEPNQTESTLERRLSNLSSQPGTEQQSSSPQETPAGPRTSLAKDLTPQELLEASRALIAAQQKKGPSAVAQGSNLGTSSRQPKRVAPPTTFPQQARTRVAPPYKRQNDQRAAKVSSTKNPSVTVRKSKQKNPVASRPNTASSTATTSTSSENVKPSLPNAAATSISSSQNVNSTAIPLWQDKEGSTTPDAASLAKQRSLDEASGGPSDPLPIQRDNRVEELIKAASNAPVQSPQPRKVTAGAPNTMKTNEQKNPSTETALSKAKVSDEKSTWQQQNREKKGSPSSSEMKDEQNPKTTTPLLMTTLEETTKIPNEKNISTFQQKKQNPSLSDTPNNEEAGGEKKKNRASTGPSKQRDNRVEELIKAASNAEDRNYEVNPRRSSDKPAKNFDFRQKPWSGLEPIRGLDTQRDMDSAPDLSVPVEQNLGLDAGARDKTPTSTRDNRVEELIKAAWSQRPVNKKASKESPDQKRSPGFARTEKEARDLQANKRYRNAVRQAPQEPTKRRTVQPASSAQIGTSPYKTGNKKSTANNEPSNNYFASDLSGTDMKRNQTRPAVDSPSRVSGFNRPPVAAETDAANPAIDSLQKATKRVIDIETVETVISKTVNDDFYDDIRMRSPASFRNFSKQGTDDAMDVEFFRSTEQPQDARKSDLIEDPSTYPTPINDVIEAAVTKVATTANDGAMTAKTLNSTSSFGMKVPKVTGAEIDVEVLFRTNQTTESNRSTADTSKSSVRSAKVVSAGDNSIRNRTEQGPTVQNFTSRERSNRERVQTKANATATVRPASTTVNQTVVKSKPPSEARPKPRTRLNTAVTSNNSTAIAEEGSKAKKVLSADVSNTSVFATKFNIDDPKAEVEQLKKKMQTAGLKISDFASRFQESEMVRTAQAAASRKRVMQRKERRVKADSLPFSFETKKGVPPRTLQGVALMTAVFSSLAGNDISITASAIPVTAFLAVCRGGTGNATRALGSIAMDCVETVNSMFQEQQGNIVEALVLTSRAAISTASVGVQIYRQVQEELGKPKRGEQPRFSEIPANAGPSSETETLDQALEAQASASVRKPSRGWDDVSSSNEVRFTPPEPSDFVGNTAKGSDTPPPEPMFHFASVVDKRDPEAQQTRPPRESSIVVRQSKSVEIEDLEAPGLLVALEDKRELERPFARLNSNEKAEVNARALLAARLELERIKNE